jgi:hypothetical protein
VDENVLARLQFTEHNQHQVRIMHASDSTSDREDKRHAPLSQTSGILAASTNERDASFGMRCVAGDTMYSARASCGQGSLSETSRRGEGRHARRTRARRPRWPPSSARSPRAEPSPPRRRRPRRAPTRRARRSPRTRRRESRSRPSAVRAMSASALPHPARRARTRAHAIAPCDVHPVQAESASTWPGPGAGRGASLRKNAPASPLPSRTSTARIV